MEQSGNTYAATIGTDDAGKYLLAIELAVAYNSSKKQYTCIGTADWDGYSLTSGTKGPSAGDDFIAITWGGDGELKSSSKSVSGTYNTNVFNI